MGKNNFTLTKWLKKWTGFKIIFKPYQRLFQKDKHKSDSNLNLWKTWEKPTVLKYKNWKKNLQSNSSYKIQEKFKKKILKSVKWKCSKESTVFHHHRVKVRDSAHLILQVSWNSSLEKSVGNWKKQENFWTKERINWHNWKVRDKVCSSNWRRTKNKFNV